MRGSAEDIKSWFGIAMFVFIFGFSIYFGWQHSNRDGNPINNSANYGSVLLNQDDPIAGWRTYANKELGVSFKYPLNWKAVHLTKNANISDWVHGTTYTSGGFDPDRAISFSIYSKDYSNYLLPIINKPVDGDWLPADFGYKLGEILFTKKINDKSVLIANYTDTECSPMLTLKAYVPLNDNYPNLIIGIDYPFYNDTTVKVYEDNARIQGKDACGQIDIYRQIATEVYNGTYSNKLNEYISIVSLIADSVTVK